MRKLPEIKCLSCSNAMIIERGLDIAANHRTIFCKAITREGPLRVAPPEVIQCSAYENKFLTQGEGIGDFLAQALLIENHGGKLVALRSQGRRSRYFAGRYYRATNPRRRSARKAGFVTSKKKAKPKKKEPHT